MTTYKVARVLAPVDASYIAGLVDGEGTITLTRKHRGENRQLALTVSSTERQLLEFIRQRTGVGKVTNKKRTRNHHLLSYAYAVYNRQALDILRQIEPHLRSYKLHRAQLALAEYLSVTPRNGKYSPALLERKSDFESRFLNIKAAPPTV